MDKHESVIGHGDPDTVTAYTSTSGAKSSEKMPPYFLVPLRPVLDRIAARFGYGAGKYGQDNWRKGLTDREWLIDRGNHAMAHLIKVLDKLRRGVPTDDTDDDLAGVAWAMTVIAEAEATASVEHKAVVNKLRVGILKDTIAQTAAAVALMEPVVAPVISDTPPPDLTVSPSAKCWVCSLTYEQHQDRVSNDSRPGHIRVTDTNVRTLHFFELASPGPHKSWGDPCDICGAPYRDHLPLDLESPHWRGQTDGEGRLHHWFRMKEVAR